jgi:hypothetical protein
MTKAATTTTTFFTYDHSVQRVSKGTGTATITYPTPAFSIDSSGKKTTDIFAGGILGAL